MWDVVHYDRLVMHDLPSHHKGMLMASPTCMLVSDHISWRHCIHHPYYTLMPLCCRVDMCKRYNSSPDKLTAWRADRQVNRRMSNVYYCVSVVPVHLCSFFMVSIYLGVSVISLWKLWSHTFRTPVENSPENRLQRAVFACQMTSEKENILLTSQNAQNSERQFESSFFLVLELPGVLALV